MSQGRITTFTGRHLDPLNLQPEDVDLRDVAHALACVNRFAGHARKPVSVAQHSVYVSRLVPERHALAGLLHDASEAYLGDVPKWLKSTDCYAGYREAEERAQRAIFASFGLPPELPFEVDDADRLMVRFEAERIMPPLYTPDAHKAKYPPTTANERTAVGNWQPWGWAAAEEGFIGRYNILMLGGFAPERAELKVV